MFRAKKRWKKVAVLNRRIMSALNRLNFLLTYPEFVELAKERKGVELGMIVEADIWLHPDTDYFQITFLTNKDFELAKKEGLERPADTRKTTVNVDNYTDKVKFWGGPLHGWEVHPTDHGSIHTAYLF